MSEKLTSYKPSGFFFRKAWREATTVEERAEIFEALVRDHESLREWVRQQGMIPPKFEVTLEELNEKPWLVTLLPPADPDQLELDLPAGAPLPGQVLPFASDDSRSF